jgi:hypothetical protein
MKKLLVMSLATVFVMAGMASAQNLLTNADFELVGLGGPNDALDWDQWGGDFNNRELAPADFAPNTSYVVSVGGWSGNVSAGLSQTVSATAGNWYKLQVDSVIEAWWNLEGYLQLEFLDVGDNVLKTTVSPHWSAPGNDIGLAPDTYSLFSVAPAGTDSIVATLGGIGPGGTVRFDNAVLEVVPEPATLGMLGLSGLAVWFIRRRV